jgi:SnoaL-like domain
VSEDENYEVVRRFNQSVNAEDLSVLDDLLASDFVAHGGEQDIRGRDGWKQFILSGREQFGDSESGIDELLGNGNLVAERWWIRAAAGTRRGITMHRIADGKIAEDWAVWEDSYNDGVTPPTATS